MNPPPSWPFRLSLKNGKWIVNKSPRGNHKSPKPPKPDELERNLL